jgi:hypothetical protein
MPSFVIIMTSNKLKSLLKCSLLVLTVKNGGCILVWSPARIFVKEIVMA